MYQLVVFLVLSYVPNKLLHCQLHQKMDEYFSHKISIEVCFRFTWAISFRLTHFMLLISFDTPWKQKTRGFLMFSGGIKKRKNILMVNHFGSLKKTYDLSNHWLTRILYETSEPVTQKCSVKKVFFEISQNSQENTCARVSFLINLQASAADSGTDVFLWILRNFKEHLFLRNTSAGCFCI